MGNTHRMRVGRRTVEIHRPDKVLFPGGGDSDGDGHRGDGDGDRGHGNRGDGGGRAYTKADLVAYHRAVAPFMLPHLRGRPLMLERHPDGIDGPMFMQKNTPGHYPDWIERVEVTKEGGTVVHPVCEDAATLVYLADQACLTLHRWLSRTGDVHRPDRLVVDLDPAVDDFATVRDAAVLVRELLDELRLPSVPMTTGSRGVHVVVPLNGRADFDEVRAFAGEIAGTLVRAHPGRLTTEARKKDRGDRLYLDIQRNAYAQTAVAPYTVRALPGAPVAAPLTWEQLADPAVDARRWTLADALDQARTDPWAGAMSRGRALGPARRRLAALHG
ncbi:non-homologous end-joining DNA ligase [Streptomyces scabiei]|uniref:non-homologous end-joining DNA ligase n=4 Tax=Streptomyces scabiei TaxID=1930 RepID=UPI000776DDAF|nr:non-homologous end-joining DNA ligase [Streptomyces scabiei]MBP5927641.1 ATP-dependent DNA ligase [Streptomyces sp. LBUM 1479]MDX2532411.1 non-homologous end-joining DNA ligase [Streptomyces scabiei]MDX2794715.1 non-homologous end-joining DNA ligase [Streptomyces scabiei]MDX2856631.1 non-homologous end-joining DNA ligase [Streptomyces scabiei]MDX3822283.1 non-homologous end-joining DNA ligase [Streptomyces scabiei]